jgi:hypothetical protein
VLVPQLNLIGIDTVSINTPMKNVTLKPINITRNNNLMVDNNENTKPRTYMSINDIPATMLFTKQKMMREQECDLCKEMTLPLIGLVVGLIGLGVFAYYLGTIT